MRYEDTPIGEVTERAKRDMDLIRGDVERKDWPSVINGVRFQAEAFAELLVQLEKLQRQGNLK